ncbi:tyrosine-type recombinase/integrase [Thiothrix winogradskyi]|uniref:Integrase arm-type DNA-binding domain-containing protein n=1 Tax=Thiothrix winogradskyi TaxID=96472 RepID=A0ABY3T2K2_9GAMM|nr:integrase arm-type DNA-binding domain-containing protein [Thiothrix winogradskyi]UJS26057.1 integrase arm-type DNA-binding domain-containing protein [Thiothrix winogradskyi]
MPITNTQADNAKPKAQTYRLNDGGGLQLEIRPSGRKCWLYRYRNPSTKKPTVHTIGEYPQVKIGAARTKLMEVKGMIAKGIDPNAQKQRDKMRGQGETFKDVALEWYEKRKPKWTETNATQTLQSLELDVFPYIGGRVASELEPPDLMQIIKRIESRGSLSKAGKILARLRSILQYAMDTGKIKTNPTPSPGALTARPSGNHFNALTLADLPAFMADLEAYRSEVLRRAVQFTLLTFARTGSVRMAEWQEIDWQAKTWNIPAAHMKMGEAHIVPLSRQALELLQALQPFTRDSRLIFYTNHPDKVLSSNALLQVIRRIGWKEKTTVHGFRALASSAMHDAGFEPKVIEKQLAHAERNKIAGAYNYMAQYMPERIRLMQWWGDFLDSQRIGANVVVGKFGQNRT